MEKEKMIFLIDTTTNPTAIGFFDGKNLKTKTIEQNSDSNRKLVSVIQKFICNLGFDICNLQAVGLVNGPGTFTGVRTGTTIANTIGYALGAPIYALDTLTASVGVDPCACLSGRQVDPNSGKHGGLPLRKINNVVALLSASNTEVFFARFEKGKMQGKIEIVGIENLKNRLHSEDLIVGDLSEKHCGINGSNEFRSVESMDRITNLLELILDKKIKPAKQVLPLYIKKPNITTKKKV